MVDWYGRWTYEPNTLEKEKCDMDRLADWVTSTGFKPQTNIENVCWMILGHYVKDSGGIEEFDYYC